jgi:hypothetical protein
MKTATQSQFQIELEKNLTNNMRFFDLFLFISSILITFPLSHIFMKKGMILDYDLTDEKKKDLAKFFYIPYLNVITMFSYLVWSVIKFKRPE